VSTTQSPVVGELYARISERTGARAPLLRAFAEAYLRRMSADILVGRSAEELFGEIVGAFDLADRRGANPLAVRAFNPTLQADGYALPGSVLETNTPDSPFLVDSVSAEFDARGLTVREKLHPVIGVERDEAGRIVAVLHARETEQRESVMHFELERRLSSEELMELCDRVRDVLGDVQAAVRDFRDMRERVPAMVAAAQAAAMRYSADEVEEAVAFLGWLFEDNFLFLGYREYAVQSGAVSIVPGSGLGILADEASSHYREPMPLMSIEPRLRERITGGDLLLVSKTNRFATVHRHERMDYVGVKHVGASGEILGELRLIGLFTSKAYAEPAGRVPILRRKLRQIIEAEDLIEGTHDYKAAVALYESFPKDDLFGASVDDLRAEVMGLLHLEERRQVKMFVRFDAEGRSVAITIALPRDRYNVELQQRLVELLQERFGGESVDQYLSLGETELAARIHFTVHVTGPLPEVSLADLEHEVIALTRTWDDRLRERLVAIYGEEHGVRLAETYRERFPDYYKNSTDISMALVDVDQFEHLTVGEQFRVALQNERGGPQDLTRVGIYKTGGKVQLSEVLPILENLGLQVDEEVPTRLNGGDGETFLHNFGVLDEHGRLLDLATNGERVADCIAAVWHGQAESDALNRLVISAGLSWHQVAVVRAYRKYRQRVGAQLPIEYQNATFARHPTVSALLVRYFEVRFDPNRPIVAGEEDALRQEVLAALDAITSLDDDRILRNHLGTVDATVRTNAFLGRPHLSFKFASAAVPLMPKPYPLYEIFVYSPAMEGIHLRGGRVARGGIRWSDRPEDYRTEILGLMKAQMVKNAVIVPVGSKGGFVLKHPPADRTALREEVVRQYTTLMSGMLDITDNLVNGAVVQPTGVRILDGEDPYLVVAADKGTAALSDTANAISESYGFWLGDAFASGGSAGYDHKKLAITARGAWESVKRHFRELGLDVATEAFTVVGIGDMSGDVFGNGMLLSNQIRLVGAFDHRHLFLDPDPDPAAGFAERKRLYDLPGSSWDDYDRTKISTGGGVFGLDAKSVPLGPEIRAALGLDDSVTALPPAELKTAILRSPVDLFWNGGIGTFVKASDESHAEVGDRTNDAIRIDGRDLRVRVVGEGGNLGFTQRGRIEYAAAGGRINTDAVDNSAGVDCSDHEVNLKILLGIPEAAGDLTRKQRDELLAEVEDDVCRHVLYDNYLQAQILSQEVAVSQDRIEAYDDLMHRLENDALLERPIEFLPTSDEMAERHRQGRAMERPELCVLLAYAKRSLKTALLEASLVDDPYLDRELRGYFPPKIVERFGDLLRRHALRRELVATIMANDVVNSQGITFVSRLCSETGAEQAEVVRAYYVARQVTGAVARWSAIEALDGMMDPSLQNELMVGVDHMVEDVARWYLLHPHAGGLDDVIAPHSAAFAELAGVIDTAGPDDWRAHRTAVADALVERGVDPELARKHAWQPELTHSPDIAQVAQVTGRSLQDVATTFFLVGEQLHIDALERRVFALHSESRWERWAALAMEDDLMAVRREVAERVLLAAPDSPVEEAVELYLATRSETYERLNRLLAGLDGDIEVGLAALTVALRQVRGVAA
jgi:glutamate dehydrogenase